MLQTSYIYLHSSYALHQVAKIYHLHGIICLTRKRFFLCWTSYLRLPATYKQNCSLYQENIDSFHDEDDEIDPAIICIPKCKLSAMNPSLYGSSDGVSEAPLPRPLILFRLADTHFELQPAYSTHLDGAFTYPLNSQGYILRALLSAFSVSWHPEFYVSRGVAILAETWLASHRYDELQKMGLRSCCDIRELLTFVRCLYKHIRACSVCTTFSVLHSAFNAFARTSIWNLKSAWLRLRCAHL